MDGTDRAAATVVLSRRVREGAEADYERWQSRIDDAVSGFEGFEGSEVLRPRPGVQDAWVVVYRFDSADSLSVWLRSDTRMRLVEEGEPLFEDFREHVVATPRGPDRPVTVVVSQRVEPEHEQAFERWQDGITAAAARYPGFLGAETFKPVDGVQDEWVVVFRFASNQTLRDWLDSDERKGWIERATPWREDVAIQTVGSGLGGWFATHPRAPSAPPDWKQSLAVLIALYPTVMLLTRFLSPQLEKVTSLPVNIFIGNVVSVAILTWVLMPLTTRVLGPWLHPKDSRTTLVGTVLVGLACAAMVALFLAVE